MIIVRGQILVSRTDDDTLHPMCGFESFPCVRSKRPLVYRHHAHMFQHMCAWCRHTRDVLNVHTEAFFKPNTVFSRFSACRNTNKLTHKHTHKHTHTNTQTPHTTQHNTQHRTETATERDRERETENERQRKREREKERVRERKGDREREKSEG